MRGILNPGRSSFNRLQDFLDRVDGVDIVTPADNHLAICSDCFDKRKDVFVEKPIALTSEEAKEMITQANKKGVILQVGHVYRYHPASLKIKSLIGEDRWGKSSMPTAISWGSRGPGRMSG